MSPSLYRAAIWSLNLRISRQTIPPIWSTDGAVDATKTLGYRVSIHQQTSTAARNDFPVSWAALTATDLLCTTDCAISACLDHSRTSSIYLAQSAGLSK